MTDTKPTAAPVPCPYCEKTSRGYDVSGPDRDGDMCVEFDVETNMIWLTRRDVELLLARWPNTIRNAMRDATATGRGGDNASRED